MYVNLGTELSGRALAILYENLGSSLQIKRKKSINENRANKYELFRTCSVYSLFLETSLGTMLTVVKMQDLYGDTLPESQHSKG